MINIQIMLDLIIKINNSSPLPFPSRTPTRGVHRVLQMTPPSWRPVARSAPVVTRAHRPLILSLAVYLLFLTQLVLDPLIVASEAADTLGVGVRRARHVLVSGI